MGTYLFAYKGGGMAESEEEQQQVMSAWMGWFGGLGDAVVDMGAPFGASTGLGSESAPDLTGYSIVSAPGLDEARAMAAGCPVLERGGTVEVYEALQM